MVLVVSKDVVFFCYMFGICYYIIGVCKDGCKSGWKGVECLEGIFKKKKDRYM